MKAFVRTAGALAIALAMLLGTAPAAEPKTPRDLGPILKPIVEHRGVPGMVGAIVDGRSLAGVGAAGVRRLKSDTPVTVDDQFHIGSCTKAMTATLAAMLVESGELKWDSTFAGLFPELRSGIRLDYRGVTLAQLLVHRGGLPRDAEYTGPAYSSSPPDGVLVVARSLLLSKLLAKEPASKPGDQFLYSNAGYALAAAMIEKVSRQSWESLLRQRLFKPLDMPSAGFGAPGRKDTLDQPRGHTADGKPIEPGPQADNLAVLGPAGGVHCSIADWAKFVTLHLRGHVGDARLLKADTFQKLHEPGPGDGKTYAMGWGVADRKWGGGRVWTHTGSNTYWFAVVWMAPTRDFAVLAACNQGGPEAVRACDDACWALIHDYYVERAKRETK